MFSNIKSYKNIIKKQDVTWHFEKTEIRTLV